MISFLDFFYTRLKPLAESSVATKLDADTRSSLDRQGYSFISLCGKDGNYVRSQDTPIVFKALVKEGNACRPRSTLIQSGLNFDRQGNLLTLAL